jgi:hypothetical protein
MDMNTMNEIYSGAEPHVLDYFQLLYGGIIAADQHREQRQYPADLWIGVDVERLTDDIAYKSGMDVDTVRAGVQRCSLAIAEAGGPDRYVSQIADEITDIFRDVPWDSSAMGRIHAAVVQNAWQDRQRQ